MYIRSCGGKGQDRKQRGCLSFVVFVHCWLMMFILIFGDEQKGCEGWKRSTQDTRSSGLCCEALKKKCFLPVIIQPVWQITAAAAWGLCQSLTDSQWRGRSDLWLYERGKITLFVKKRSCKSEWIGQLFIISVWTSHEGAKIVRGSTDYCELRNTQAVF